MYSHAKDVLLLIFFDAHTPYCLFPTSLINDSYKFMILVVIVNIKN